MVSKTSSGSVNVAKSAVPSNQNDKPPITRIAIKSLPTYQWEPPEHCPFRGSRDPLEKVREAVEDGSMVMFTRKIAPFYFELWARPRW